MSGSGAKQDPSSKKERALHSDGRTYFSYAQIHEAVSSAAPAILEFKPVRHRSARARPPATAADCAARAPLAHQPPQDVMVAIGGGGFIPARMLRTEVQVPILAVSLELYDDATKTANARVIKKQWFDEASGVGKLVRGRRVLVVDEVDDTRATLQYCIEELMATNAPAAIATFCVFNKLKPKKGKLPVGVQMFVGADIPDSWSCFPCARSSRARRGPAAAPHEPRRLTRAAWRAAPSARPPCCARARRWDAAAYGRDIRAHEELARQCAHE